MTLENIKELLEREFISEFKKGNFLDKDSIYTITKDKGKLEIHINDSKELILVNYESKNRNSGWGVPCDNIEQVFNHVGKVLEYNPQMSLF